MRACDGPTKPWRRVLALALAFGALVILLAATAMTTQAFVTKVGHTTLDEFAVGEFHRTGLLALPPDIESVQLLPIGLFGTWKLASQPLPIALTELSAVAGGQQVVVLGGFDAGHNCHNEVYVSTIGSGGVLGPWIEQAYPLPQPLSSAAAAIQPDPGNSDRSWIYVLGGAPNLGDSLNTVYYTTLHHDSGTIDPWITSPYTLPTPVQYLGAVAHNGYLYAVGGYSVVSPFYETVTDVSFAPIGSDGSLGPWQATEPLPEPLSSHLVLAYGEGLTNTLYVLGGGERPGLPSSATFHVYFADIHSDGSLAPWRLSLGTKSSGSLLSPIYAHSGALVNDQVLVTGGRDASNTISDTVKAALVDPGNSELRLYNWCGNVPMPPYCDPGGPCCTIGVWQSGPLLPEARAFHATVKLGSYVYTLGGIGANHQPTKSVYWGAVSEPGALYAPTGKYVSPPFDFALPADLRKVEWQTTIAFPASQGLDFRYRYRTQGGDWQPWSAAVGSIDGTNELEITPPIPNVRLFQYRIDMTTDVSNNSPLLNSVDVYYELGDPELEVHKNSGSVISVTVGDEIQYTIYYTNHGEWMAENTVLTETLPANTSYAGGSEWTQVDSSDRYTYLVGKLGRGATGSTTFRARVNDDVPASIPSITNAVEIGYPPMIDALAQEITDPKPENNYSEFSNPILHYVITITKDALPPPGQVIGQGEVITYILTYTNLARAAAAANAYIIDLVPEHTTYVPGSIVGPGLYSSNPPQIRWDLGTVGAGQKGQVRYSVRVDPASPTGINLPNTATLYSSSGAPRTSNTVTHLVVETAFKLQASKDAIPPPGSVVAPGSTLTYTLFYTSAGRIPASHAILTDTYDWTGSYTFLSANPPPKPGTDNVWDLGPLSSGDKGSIEVVVQLTNTLPSNWIITNRAGVASPEGAPAYSPVITHVVMNPPGTHLVDLVASDIYLDPATPKPGQAVDFYATISNEGTLDADQELGFWTALYIKPWPSNPPFGPSDHDQGYCLDSSCMVTRPDYVDYAGTLEQGKSKVASFKGDQLVFPTEGTYDVYVQTDVAFDDPYWNYAWGAYPEEDESNNIAHIVVTVGRPKVYLPAVLRKWP
jgi:uncharacterized repeat protein (TIGR01451 family)